jgi:hypothetical protein
LEGRGYTYFGEVFDRIVRSRRSSQSAFARKARALGYDYTQSSVSNWVRGVHGAPRDLPTVADVVYGLTEEEWEELGLAYAYGQRLPTKEDLEDIREFREFYRRLLESERKASDGVVGEPGEADREG